MVGLDRRLVEISVLCVSRDDAVYLQPQRNLLRAQCRGIERAGSHGRFGFRSDEADRHAIARVRGEDRLVGTFEFRVCDGPADLWAPSPGLHADPGAVLALS